MRDLKRSTKIKYYLTNRAILPFILSCIIIFMITASNSSYRSNMGETIVNFTSSVIFFWMFIGVPIFTARSINCEIENKTLGLLIISDLSYRGIVWGKFIQYLFSIFLNIFSTLPIFLLCASMGGISSFQIVHVFLALLGFITVAIAIGIFSSVIFSSKKAPGMAIILMIIFTSSISFFVPISYVFDYVLRDSSFFYCYVNFVLQVFSAFCILQITVFCLPKCYQLHLHKNSIFCEIFRYTFFQKKGTQNFLKEQDEVFVEKKELFQKKKKRKKKSSSLKGNPLTWYDLNFIHGQNTSTKWIFFALVSIIIYFGAQNQDIFFIGYFIFPLWMLSEISKMTIKSFQHKNKGNWKMLLLTSLSNRDILFGKIKAITIKILPYFLFSLFFVITAFIKFYTKIQPSINLESVGYLLWIFACLFNIFCATLFCSFYCKTINKANGLFALFFILWNILSAFTYFLTGIVFIVNILYAILHLMIARWFLKYIEKNIRK